MELIISLLLGATGGNIGGALIRKLNLGFIGNSMSGIVGGGMGGKILQSALCDPSDAVTSNIMIPNIIGGLAGGLLFMMLIGILKRSWTQAKS